MKIAHYILGASLLSVIIALPVAKALGTSQSNLELQQRQSKSLELKVKSIQNTSNEKLEQKQQEIEQLQKEKDDALKQAEAKKQEKLRIAEAQQAEQQRVQTAVFSSDHGSIMAQAGIAPTDYGAVEYIFQHESSWVANRTNSEGCIGLGQACPASKLYSICPTLDSICQVHFFNDYAIARYGSWSNALNIWHSQSWW